MAEAWHVGMKFPDRGRTFRAILLGLLAAGIVLSSFTAENVAWSLVSNTAILCGATAAFALPLGAALAWLLLRTDLPGARGLLVAVGCLLFVPLYLQAAAWQAGFGLEGWFTLSNDRGPWLDGWVGTVWVHTMAALPWIILIVGSGLRLVEAELEQAALLDAGTLGVARRITMRRASGFIAAAALWVVVSIAGEMTVTDLFRIRTYAEVLYLNLALGESPETAATDSLVSLLLIAWLVLAGIVLSERLAPPSRVVLLDRLRTFELRHWRMPLLVITLIVVTLLVAVPLGSLIYKSGVVVEQLGQQRIRRWSPAHSFSLVVSSPKRLLEPLGWSLLISCVTASAALLTGLLAAWAARQNTWARWICMLLIGVGLALPGPLIQFAMIGIFNRHDPSALTWLLNPIIGGQFELFPFLYDRTIVPACAGLWIRTAPIVTLVVWYGLSTLASEPLDAARAEGVGWLARLWYVAVPQIRGLLAAAWLIGVALSFGDVSSSLLLLPPGVTTMAVHIFNLLHYGVDDRLAADCLTTLIPVATLGWWICRRLQPRRNA